jgi:hypothetical protein
MHDWELCLCDVLMLKYMATTRVGDFVHQSREDEKPCAEPYSITTIRQHTIRISIKMPHDSLALSKTSGSCSGSGSGGGSSSLRIIHPEDFHSESPSPPGA